MYHSSKTAHLMLAKFFFQDLNSNVQHNQSLTSWLKFDLKSQIFAKLYKLDETVYYQFSLEIQDQTQLCISNCGS